VRVDRKFEAHRRRLEAENAPCVDHLTPEQLKTIKQADLRHLLEEDEEVRLDGFEEPHAIAEGEDPIEHEPRSIQVFAGSRRRRNAPRLLPFVAGAAERVALLPAAQPFRHSQPWLRNSSRDRSRRRIL